MIVDNQYFPIFIVGIEENAGDAFIQYLNLIASGNNNAHPRSSLRQGVDDTAEFWRQTLFNRYSTAFKMRSQRAHTGVAHCFLTQTVFLKRQCLWTLGSRVAQHPRYMPDMGFGQVFDET